MQRYKNYKIRVCGKDSISFRANEIDVSASTIPENYLKHENIHFKSLEPDDAIPMTYQTLI